MKEFLMKAGKVATCLGKMLGHTLFLGFLWLVFYTVCHTFLLVGAAGGAVEDAQSSALKVGGFIALLLLANLGDKPVDVDAFPEP